MASLNNVEFIGNVVRNVDLHDLGNGKSVINNAVAVQREFKNTNGEYDTDFIEFSVFNASATFMSKYVAKGDTIYIQGRLEIRNYQDKNGNMQKAFGVVVEKLKLISKPKTPQNQEQEQVNDFIKQNQNKVVERETTNDITDDDLPF